ncbi:MAG: hypothetical protein V2A73_14590 [Pseudomonadota bacterium]
MKKLARTLLGMATTMAMVLSWVSVAQAGAGTPEQQVNQKTTHNRVATPAKPMTNRDSPTAATEGVASPSAIRAGRADDLAYGDPIHFHNLTLVPVGTTRQGPFQKYRVCPGESTAIARSTVANRLI